MSFILDALRKSESERQREASTNLSRAPLATVRHRVPAWTWSLIVLLSIALIALAAAWWRSNLFLPPELTTTATAPAAVEQSIPPALPDPEPAPAPAAEAPARLRPIGELSRIEPSLPAYRLELIAHNSRDPAAGSAWINGRRYFVGERIGAGPELVEVRPDGVVLSYDGSEFLLTTR